MLNSCTLKFKCFLNEIAQNGDVRLRGGLSNSEGRVEIFHNGEWGTICGIGWDETNTDVTCRHLGFKASNGTGEFMGAYVRVQDVSWE